MSMSVGASSNALSYLQQLLQSGAGGAGATSTDPLLALDQGTDLAPASNQTGSSPSPIWSGATASFEPGTLAALISLQGQSASGVVGQSPSHLFSQIDTDGDGQISKSEFEQALGAVGVDAQSADALFGRLDSNDDGSITPGEIGRSHGGGHHHHHMAAPGGASGSAGPQDALSSLLSGADIAGATTQTATNSDGSTTTTVTYADGTSVSTTSPAASQNSGTPSDGSSDTDGSGSSTAPHGTGNLIEELIRLQSQLVSQAAATLSTIA